MTSAPAPYARGPRVAPDAVTVAHSLEPIECGPKEGKNARRRA